MILSYLAMTNDFILNYEIVQSLIIVDGRNITH